MMDCWLRTANMHVLQAAIVTLSFTVHKKNTRMCNHGQHACVECGHIHAYMYTYAAIEGTIDRLAGFLLLDSTHAHVRVHHAMCRPQANWLSLFPDPSFVQCSPRSAALGTSGVVAGGRGAIEQCAQQVQESEVTRLVSKVQTLNSVCV